MGEAAGRSSPVDDSLDPVAPAMSPEPRRSSPPEEGDESLDPIAAAMVAEGRALRLVTRGRRTGRPVAVAVGFVEEPDGSFLVAAGDPDADWALNLLADPRCRVEIGEVGKDAEAELLEGPELARAVRELILRYGTPAERLGNGPAFRLRPRATGSSGGGVT